MSSTARVRRRAVACARCRLRKVLCDALSPACTRCVEAGVPCVALDSYTKRAAPRSIAQYLETEIANRESRGSLESFSDTVNGVGTAIRGTAPSYSLSFQTETACTLSELVFRDFTPSFLGLSAAVALARCAVVGTRIPSTRLFGATDIDEHHPRSILNPQPSGASLQSIPIEASSYLFTNYMDRVAAQYPIFHAKDITAFYFSVFHQSPRNLHPGEASAYEVYVISLVMAISLTTAARTQQARASSIAAGLFKNAIRQIPEVLTNDVQGLQALLLLLQYSFLDPAAANIWLLSGFASQACIDLGLHQDPPSTSKISVLARDIRRRVFWCTYEMEIAVCAALLRPTNFLSKYINVPFPTEIEDNSITDNRIDPTGRLTKFTSRYIWQFRKIEAEIVSVLFQNGDIPISYNSLGEWMDAMHKAIYDWDNIVHQCAASNSDPSTSSKWAEMDLYAHIATPYVIVTLYRPCPRNKDPKCEDLMKAFRASMKVADGYWQQANLDFGNSKYVFHPCHHTFSSAVAFLQALQRCKDTICISYTSDDVEGFMRSFSRLFATIAERWPAASKCLDEYERLLAPVKKDYLDFIAQRARTQSFSHETPILDNLAGLHGDLMDPAMHLDDMFNFGSFFHPSEVSPAGENNWLYSPVPENWNAEFDFEMT